MTCPQCRGLDSLFNQREAARNLKSYRASGPDTSTRILLDALTATSVAGQSVLDIGGGVGAAHHELLKAGAQTATDVDASSAYLAAAREEATRQGHADRVTYTFGNFIDLADEVAPADIVTLDRVLCCYPDMPALVRASASHARRLYGIVYPRDVWWMRAGARVFNGALALQRTPYRFYPHRTAAVESAVREVGLEPLFARISGFWQIAVYQRQ